MSRTASPFPPRACSTSAVSSSASTCGLRAVGSLRIQVPRARRCPGIRARLARVLTEIAACLIAAVTIHGDASHAACMLNPLPNEFREIFQRRGPQRLDAIEQLVIEHLLHIADAALELPEIHDHSGLRIRLTANRDLRAERVPMDLLAGGPQGRAGDRMGGFEPERFGQLPHHRIPSNLWVWRLKLHCGCSRQYSTARAVFSSSSGPSIGCSENRLKQRSA